MGTSNQRTPINPIPRLICVLASAMMRALFAPLACEGNQQEPPDNIALGWSSNRANRGPRFQRACDQGQAPPPPCSSEAPPQPILLYTTELNALFWSGLRLPLLQPWGLGRALVALCWSCVQIPLVHQTGFKAQPSTRLEKPRKGC